MMNKQTILVFLPNWVGDVVMATPLLAALREQRPTDRIVHAGRPAPLAVLDGCDFADETITLQKGTPAQKEIRAAQADVALLLPNSFRSAWLAWRGGIKRRIGYARDLRRWLLTDPVQPTRDAKGAFAAVPEIDSYNALGEVLGIESNWNIQLQVTDRDAQAAAKLMQSDTGDNGDHGDKAPWVLLNAGAANNLHKLWPAERFAALADALTETVGAKIILHGSPADAPIVRQVAAAMKRPPALDFTVEKGSIGLLKAMVQRSDLVVTNDTGARHIAAALHRPTLTLFISTDPEWARIDSPHETILTINKPFQLVTPDSPEHHAMRDGLTLEAVLQESLAILNAGAGT
jgi:heptosyltransferase-2